ncbi:MAG: hypothetical protein SRB2_04781 [Desulfobacteraceae bacterium Eth-SRB2]|nr:MAG: hypothetical protein SRB2_04781 [Desulfobacteraceae bacterium Eth-SRB2]
MRHNLAFYETINLTHGIKCANLCRDNHPVDVSLGFGLAKRWSKRWYNYASLGYTLYESREVLEPATSVTG